MFRCKIGDAFASLPAGHVIKHIEVLHAKLSGQIQALETECDMIRADLNRLKVLLYGKFSTSIHLEADDA